MSPSRQLWSAWPRSPSKTLLVVCLAVVVGTAAHAFWEHPTWPWGWVSAALGAVALAWSWPRGTARRLLFLALAFCLAAVARYDFVLQTPSAYQAPPSGNSEFTGRVRSVSGSATDFVAEDVKIRGQPVPFSVAVSGPLPSNLLPGDTVAWTCRPQAASRDDAGNSLLLLGQPGWRCPVSEVRRVTAGPLTINRLAAMARLRLRAQAAAVLPETESALLMGLFAGERSGLPPKLSQAFRDTGTAHVLAVSGTNVSQVTIFVLIALALLAVPRPQAILLAAFFVLAFTVFVGFGASVIRAALMGGWQLAAGLLGRRYDAVIALSLAAAVMLLANPLILRHDIGFRLSFAAVVGLQMFRSHFKAFFARRLPDFVADALGTALAATLMTAPICLFDFGILALVSPLANLFVEKLVELGMLLGLAAIVASVLCPPLGVLFGLLAWLPLKLLVAAVSAFGLVPPLPLTISFLDLVVAYALLLWWAWHLRQREKERLNAIL